MRAARVRVMDPDACLQRWVSALQDEDHAEAIQAHEDLTAWLARGGFEPAWKPSVKLCFRSFDPKTGSIRAEVGEHLPFLIFRVKP